MKLVIIAAGRGSRLSSISEGIPKILIEVYNKTLLEHLIHNCVLVGITDIVIVTGHNSSMIDDYISKKEFRVNIELIYNADWELPNGVSVLASKNSIPKDDDFMISMIFSYLRCWHILCKRASKYEKPINVLAYKYEKN